MNNRDRSSRNQGRDCCMDITLTPGMNEYGQAYTYGKPPVEMESEADDNVPTSLYYDGVPKY